MSGAPLFGTAGHGSYNAHSSAQHSAASRALAFLLPQAIAALAPHLPLQDGAETGACVSVVDYGCSEGKNSRAHLSTIVSALRSSTSAGGAGLTPITPLSVVYEDQPHNDWTSLVSTVTSAAIADALSGPNIFPLCAPTSFYQQVLPPGTVLLGWSNASTHWLSSAPPARLTTAVWSYAATSPSERVAWQAFAARDWANFLAARARELQPGGVLLLSALLIDPDAGHPPPPVGEDEPLWRILRRMEAAGQLTADDLTHISFATYYRTREETCGEAVLEPHGLRMLAIESHVGDSPFRAAWRQHGDAALYARQQSGLLRTSGGSSMLEVAVGKVKADAVFAFLEAAISADSESFDFYLPLGSVLLQKVPR